MVTNPPSAERALVIARMRRDHVEVGAVEGCVPARPSERRADCGGTQLCEMGTVGGQSNCAEVSQLCQGFDWR